MPVNQRTRGSALRLLLGATLALCAWMIIGSYANAQGNGLGVISGTVTDPTKAVIVGANVTITNVATAVSETYTTNSTGYFESASLIPGTYTISVASPGFETLKREGITLEAAARIEVPLSLKTGATTSVVTVYGDVTLLNTENGSDGQVLTHKQVENLPVSGANPAWLIELAPGVQTPLSQTYSVDGTLSWDGPSNLGTTGNASVDEYTLDGAINSRGAGNGYNPTQDELDEMKMDVTGFDASVGHTMGVAITQSSKSGTNDLHGDFRWNYEDKRWSAKNHFQGVTYQHQEGITGCNGSTSTTKFNLLNPLQSCLAVQYLYGWPGTHENNGDLTFTGPVVIPKLFNGRDKLFFMASVLDDVFSGVSSTSATVPTAQEVGGNFSDLPAAAAGSGPATFYNGNSALGLPGCGANATYYGQYQLYNPYSTVIDSSGIPRRAPICGNVIPSNLLAMANSGMTKLMNSLWPAPTNSAANASGNFVYTKLVPQIYRSYTGRLDYALGQNNRLFARYTQTHYNNKGSGFTTNGIDASSGYRNVVLTSVGWIHTFNSKTTMNVTAGGMSYGQISTGYPGYDAYSPGGLGLPSYADAYAKANSHQEFPVFSFSGYNGLGNTDSQPYWARTISLRGNLARVQGRHTIEAGAEWRWQERSQRSGGNVNGTYSFDDSYDQANNGNDKTSGQAPSNTGLSYAAFLMGVQTTSAVAYSPRYDLFSPYYGLYVGDTWRVSPKLTVIPGIRFEYEYGVTEAHNQMIAGWDFNAAQPVASVANTAYQTIYGSLPSAQQQYLPTSLTIQGGPMYAGVNGASTRLWNNNYRVLPRLFVSYQLTHSDVITGGYGLFFDGVWNNAGYMSQGPGLDQDGFATSTSVPSSSGTQYGTNFTGGPSPLNNPFPTVGGTQFNSPIGSAAGSMYYLGTGGPGTVYQHNHVPARSHRVEFGWQHQFGASTVVELAWEGAITTNISPNEANFQNHLQNYTYTPAQFYQGGLQPNTAASGLLSTKVNNPFALANFSGLQSSNPAEYNMMAKNSFFTQAQTTLGALVHANPMMSGLNVANAIFESKFQEIQVNAKRRFSGGLTFMGALQINQQKDRDYFANAFDQSPSWEASNGSVPVRITGEGVYELPFGHGRQWLNSGLGSKILGGFQLTGTYEYEYGTLINFGNMFFVGDINKSNIMMSKPQYVNSYVNTPGCNSNCGGTYVQWLNPGNVTATASTSTVTNNGITQTTTTCAYTGTGFVTNTNCQPTFNRLAFPPRVKGVRQQGWNNAGANMQRTFALTEKMSFQARFEAYNIFNHQQIGTPSTNVTSTQFGQVTGDGGVQNARWLNISGYLRF